MNIEEVQDLIEKAIFLSRQIKIYYTNEKGEGASYTILKITNTSENNFTTIAKAEEGTKKIGINGAAARLASVGDLVIILSYRHIEENQITPKPKIFIPEHHD